MKGSVYVTNNWIPRAMLVLIAYAASACGGAGEVQVGQDDDDRAARTEVRENARSKSFERVPQAVDERTVGKVPDTLLDAIVNDLVRRTGSAKSDIRVLRAEATTWPDGSMGCPKPGEVYTQATVDGYWVVLGYAGREYDYRAAAKGYFFLCEHARLRLPGEPGTGPIEQPPRK